MFKRFVFAILLSLTTVSAMAANPKPPSLATAKVQIQAQYKRYMEAVQKRDLAGAKKMFAPNFYITFPDGRSQGYTDAMKDLRDWLITTAGFHNWSLNVISVKKNGNEFVATVQEKLTRYAIQPGGGSETFLEQSASKDHWVYTKNGWKLHWIEMASKTSQRDTGALRKKLDARYTQLKKAYLAGSANSVIALMAPGYYEKRIGGKTMNRAQAQAALQASLKVDKITAHTYSLGKIVSSGNKTTVQVTEKTTFRRYDRKTKKNHVYVSTDTIEDIWELRGREWFLTYRDFKKNSTTRDGAPVRPVGVR